MGAIGFQTPYRTPDIRRIIANNQVVPAGNSISSPAPDNVTEKRYWGVMCYSSVRGQITIEYRIGTWRTLKTQSVPANGNYNEIFRVTAPEYRVTYTNLSANDGNVDLLTIMGD